MDPKEVKLILDSDNEDELPTFLRTSNDKNLTRSTLKTGNMSSTTNGGHYTSRCNFSLLSNYLLYLVFITQTVAFNYFAFFSNEGKNVDDCFASYYSDSP